MLRKYFLIFLFALLSLYRCEFLKKIDYELDQAEELDKLNQERVSRGLKPIEYDAQLSKFAKNEANRLAELGKLDIPSLENIIQSQPYYGLSVKITGKNKNIWRKEEKNF